MGKASNVTYPRCFTPPALARNVIYDKSEKRPLLKAREWRAVTGQSPVTGQPFAYSFRWLKLTHTIGVDWGQCPETYVVLRQKIKRL